MKLYGQELGAMISAAIIVFIFFLSLGLLVDLLRSSDYNKCLESGIFKELCYRNVYWRNESQGR